MKIVICASEADFAAIIANAQNIEWVRVDDPVYFSEVSDALAYINLHPDAGDGNYEGLQQPVFINSVANTQLASQHVIRLNGWSGFIEKEQWEIAGDVTPTVTAVLAQLGKKAIVTQNTPGFISARSIAMIVNEAYFALGENISSETDIDTAMKLGTNYPFGPFEWAAKIGLQNIYDLLQTLAITDSRYECAPALKKLVKKP
jgi:3-hydroxybutyryl-CoA dehydrogenase